MWAGLAFSSLGLCTAIFTLSLHGLPVVGALVLISSYDDASHFGGGSTIQPPFYLNYLFKYLQIQPHSGKGWVLNIRIGGHRVHPMTAPLLS